MNRHPGQLGIQNIENSIVSKYVSFRVKVKVIWGMKWAKKLRTKNEQNMSSEPFSHDGAQIRSEIYAHTRRCMEGQGGALL